MEIGISKICFTPKIGIRLIGQVEQLKTTGKYTDLYARSAYIGSKEDSILIISCDLLCLPKEITDYLRKEISKKTSIDFNNIIIHTTHTHAGPAVASIFGEENINKEENDKILESIIGSADAAYKNRKKGTIGMGSYEMSNFSFNRRYIMKDGTVEMHPYKDDPNILEAEGPADRELAALLLMDENNKVISILANYPCHTTSLERDNSKYSADFPAYAEKELIEKMNDPDLVMLYLNGPCGNICPVDVENKDTVEIGDKHSRKMGKELAEALIKIVDDHKVLKEDSEIKVSYKEIKIPIREITDKMIADAKETIEKFKGREPEAPVLSNYGNESYKNTDVISAGELLETDFWENISAVEILSLNEKYKKSNLVSVPLTVARITDILFIGIPAELFTEFSLKLKDRFKEKYSTVIVAELVNGWVGYIPTKKAFIPDIGAYEVQFLNSSKLCEDAGDIIVEEVIKMEKEL